MRHKVGAHKFRQIAVISYSAVIYIELYINQRKYQQVVVRF